VRDVIGTYLRFSPRLAAFAVASAAVVVLAAVFVHQSGSAGAPALTSVDASVLQRLDLELGPPSLPSPVTKAAAESVAREQYPDRRILESVLADCRGQQVEGTCWLVSMDPQGLTSNGGNPSNPQKPQPFTFLIVIVDAGNGEFLRSLSGT
jgi:hypothetical protein